MTIKQLNPYLNFNGTAEKAINLYQKALGAKLENLQRFGEIPGSSASAEVKNRVIHALLKIGPSTVMISDTMPDHPVAAGGNCHVCLDFDDPAEMKAKFDALSDGGKITLPIHDTFWGAKFGMVTDAFGVQWMMNCTVPKAGDVEKGVPRKVFVNLPVKDLAKSMELFSKLGFEFNPKFTDANAACMIIGPDAFAMLLVEPFFQTFTKKKIASTAEQNEGLCAVSCRSRAEVDLLMETALASGCKIAGDPQDHTFMYVRSFYDLDGHHWELFWMDPAAAQ
jgi:uncharacterized protein